jgi:hypothetical protein
VHASAFDFASEELDRLVSVHAGARRVIRSLDRVAPRGEDDQQGGNERSTEALHAGPKCPPFTAKTNPAARRGFPKLRGKDSNLDYLIQSQASYH